MIKILLLSVLAVAMIGLMVPSAFADALSLGDIYITDPWDEQVTPTVGQELRIQAEVTNQSESELQHAKYVLVVKHVNADTIDTISWSLIQLPSIGESVTSASYWTPLVKGTYTATVHLMDSADLPSLSETYKLGTSKTIQIIVEGDGFNAQPFIRQQDEITIGSYRESYNLGDTIRISGFLENYDKTKGNPNSIVEMFDPEGNRLNLRNLDNFAIGGYFFYDVEAVGERWQIPGQITVKVTHDSRTAELVFDYSIGDNVYDVVIFDNINSWSECRLVDGCLLPNPLYIEKGNGVRFAGFNSGVLFVSGTPESGEDDRITLKPNTVNVMDEVGEFPYFSPRAPWLQGTIIVVEPGVYDIEEKYQTGKIKNAVFEKLPEDYQNSPIVKLPSKMTCYLSEQEFRNYVKGAHNANFGFYLDGDKQGSICAGVIEELRDILDESWNEDYESVFNRDTIYSDNRVSQEIALPIINKISGLLLEDYFVQMDKIIADSEKLVTNDPIMTVDSKADVIFDIRTWKEYKMEQHDRTPYSSLEVLKRTYKAFAEEDAAKIQEELEKKAEQEEKERIKNEISKQEELEKQVVPEIKEQKTESIKEQKIESKPILSFVDPEKDPSHYVKRYITEETYKDWFTEHFPDYTLYEGIGITQEEYRNIVNELTKPEPVPEPEPEPEPEPIPTQESSGGGGCLIATATYGSEMAPQVQFLREIRDNTVMSTQSGTAFMTGFNQFYYSFSPAVADYERENPVFKEAVKVTLTPLLTSLTLLNYVEVDTEEEMLGYGISIILLNIGMYFVLPAAVILQVKRWKSKN